jgi:hypothetical protein
MTDQQWSHLAYTLDRINSTLDNHEARIRAAEVSRAKATGFAAALGGIFSGGVVALALRILAPLG